MIKSRFSFISEGIGFLLVTVSAFLCSYYYEIGQCVYYSIPTDYISFDLTMRGKLLFLMFTAFSFGVCMFFYFPLIDRVKNGILRKGIRIAFSIFFMLVFLFSILTPLMFESLILLSAFFGALVLWAVIYNKGNVSNIKGAEYWKHKILLIPRPAGTFISSWMYIQF